MKCASDRPSPCTGQFSPTKSSWGHLHRGACYGGISYSRVISVPRGVGPWCAQAWVRVDYERIGTFPKNLSRVSFAELEAKEALALKVRDRHFSILRSPVRELSPVMLQLVTIAPLNFAELSNTDVHMFRNVLDQVLILEGLDEVHSRRYFALQVGQNGS